MRKANRQIRFWLAPKSRHISLLAAGVVLCGWLSSRLFASIPLLALSGTHPAASLGTVQTKPIDEPLQYVSCAVTDTKKPDSSLLDGQFKWYTYRVLVRLRACRPIASAGRDGTSGRGFDMS